MNSAVWPTPSLDAGIGDQPVSGGNHVAGAQRRVECQIDRRQACGVAAVAGAVRAQRLAIGEGVLAVGITFAAARRTRRRYCRRNKTLVALAGQNAWHSCTGVALPRGQRKIFAVAAAHAKRRSGAGDATGAGGGAAAGSGRTDRRRNWLAAAPARCCFCRPPKKKSNRPSAEAGPGTSASGAAQSSATHHAAPHAPKSQLFTQRLLHPTQQTRMRRFALSRIHLSSGW